MSGSKNLHVLGFLLAVMVIAACLLATWRTNQDPDRQKIHKGGWGSAEEAFDVASRAIKDYLQDQPIRIDPQFRATLHSRSKLWTVKGYALCPSDDNKQYRWTVILNYHGLQDWEILAKIVTPEFADASPGPGGSAQGPLFSPESADPRPAAR